MKIGPNPGKEGTVYEPFDISVSEKFIIMILADPDVQSSPALQGRQLEYSEMLRLSGQCAEIFDSQLPEDFRTEHHDGGGFLSFVLCTDCEDTSPQDHEKLWQELRAALNRALELCFDRLDLRLRLSVSSAHPNNGSVYDAFQEAFSIAEHFSFLDNGRLIITSDDLFMPVGGSAVRPELEKLWFGYTADCSYDAAKQTLKSIVAQKSAAPATTVTLKPELISRLDYTIYMLCDCSGIGRTNGDFLLRKVEELRAAKNIDDLYGCIDRVYDAVAAVITGRSAGADWADRISQYVRSNYADPSLNAKKIASRFGLNPAYVSDMFHKSTGMKLLDYIHNVRLEHIRDMLENTSLSLPEIASRTGYYDRYAMSRVFSRHIGCPPSEYRKK